MNLRQIVYVSGQKSLSDFLFKLLLPFILGVTVCLIMFFYILYFIALIDTPIFIILAATSPLLTIGLFALGIMVMYSNWKGNVDNNMPLFVTFLGTVSNKGEKYSDFFKRVASNDDYGKISSEMKNIYSLATNWKLGYAKACRVVAESTPSKVFSRFLLRLANIIEYGEDIGPYLVSEQESLMGDVEVSFHQSVYFIPTISELFNAVIFSFGFLTVFAIILPLFLHLPIEMILILLAVLLLVFDGFFVIFAKSLLPHDSLSHDLKEKSKEQKLMTLNLIQAGTASAILAVIMFMFTDFNLSFRVAIIGTPCLIGGYFIRQQENTIKTREQSFIHFISTLGESADKHRGSFEILLKKIKIYTYEKLNPLIDRLFARVSVTRNIFISWLFFSIESGSRLIHKFGSMFLNAIYSGSEPSQVGRVISGNMGRLLRMRKLREQTSGGAMSEIYGAFAGVALIMFITAGLSVFLVGIFTSFNLGGDSVAVPAVGFLDTEAINVDIVRNAMVALVLVHAAFSAVLIKILDGGLLPESLTHFAIMLWIAAALDVAVMEVFKIMMTM